MDRCPIHKHQVSKPTEEYKISNNESQLDTFEGDQILSSLTMVISNMNRSLLWIQIIKTTEHIMIVIGNVYGLHY